MNEDFPKPCLSWRGGSKFTSDRWWWTSYPKPRREWSSPMGESSFCSFCGLNWLYLGFSDLACTPSNCLIRDDLKF